MLLYKAPPASEINEVGFETKGMKNGGKWAAFYLAFIFYCLNWPKNVVYKNMKDTKDRGFSDLSSVILNQLIQHYRGNIKCNFSIAFIWEILENPSMQWWMEMVFHSRKVPLARNNLPDCLRIDILRTPLRIIALPSPCTVICVFLKCCSEESLGQQDTWQLCLEWQ